MSRFLFYCGTDQIALAALKQSAEFIWGETDDVTVGAFVLYFPRAECERVAFALKGNIGAIAGYVNHDNKDNAGVEVISTLESAHNMRFLRAITDENSWPLDNHWTGSFAAVAFSTTRQELVMCNDLIGYIPLYFSIANGGIFGGTSLIALGRCLRSAPDITGIVQRLTAPFCNYGRRTPLTGILRLLPGEFRRMSYRTLSTEVTFDNTLCRSIIEPEINTAARKVWTALQREISVICGFSDRINIALSGGWDSRHILIGAVNSGRAVRCLTYGSKTQYETRIAQRCAAAMHVPHSYFENERKYFPPSQDLKRMVRDSESAFYPEWWCMLEGVGYGSKLDEVMLLGDMCETIQGRRMDGGLSFEARRREYLMSLIGVKQTFRKVGVEAFDRWKQAKKAQLLEAILRGINKLAAPLKLLVKPEVLSTEISEDLELSFSRVRDNMPPFEPMLDELFEWFHNVRLVLSSQCLLVGSTFRTFCPAMGMQFLRLMSTVHPRLRRNRRLIAAIARLSEFKVLSTIPTSQIPWVGEHSPLPLRLTIWGVRSGMDRWLMRRCLRKKNVNCRRRLLESFDLLQEYRREGTNDTVRQWFSEHWIAREMYFDKVRKRGDFTSWPLGNVDIVSAANLSMVLDLCKV